MKLKDFFDSAKEKFSSLIETVTDYAQENKKNTLIILGGALIILITLIILIIVLSTRSKEPKTVEVENNVQLTESLIVPDGPEIQRE